MARTSRHKAIPVYNSTIHLNMKSGRTTPNTTLIDITNSSSHARRWASTDGRFSLSIEVAFYSTRALADSVAAVPGAESGVSHSGHWVPLMNPICTTYNVAG